MLEERSITKSEIESIIKGKDDFVKIDYLNRFLEKADNIEVKKFIFLNLAAVSENRGLMKEAAKQISAAADISITYREKMEFYMKEAEFLIKLGDFVSSDKVFKRAYFYGNSHEREQMKAQYFELYKMIGKIEEDKGKLRRAIKVYEKLITLIQDGEKKDIMNLIIGLYEKTGEIEKANDLRKRLS
ncbi:MAG: hypothetical protein U9Q06_04045 [Nanoarchaeota archaeon]|nr:hypothetical protein [Nanoarchaeota archaeon]